jgi:hypothetical protein
VPHCFRIANVERLWKFLALGRSNVNIAMQTRAADELRLDYDNVIRLIRVSDCPVCRSSARLRQKPLRCDPPEQAFLGVGHWKAFSVMISMNVLSGGAP